jgi:hypothetical protein
MALSVQPVIEGVTASFKLGHGLILVVRDITSSDVGTDYSGGFNIGALAAQMGLSKILFFVQASIRAAAGTHRLLLPSWDVANGKLMFGENAAAVGAFDQVDPDTDIVDGDIIRVVLIGVGP